MRKALPLLALVLLSAGCGRSYTGADVQRALGSTKLSSGSYYVDSSRTVFATTAAVTDLVVAETPSPPQGVYDGGSVVVQRYRTRHDAWLATHAFGWRAFASPSVQGGRVILRRHANLVLIGDPRRVAATIARLH